MIHNEFCSASAEVSPHAVIPCPPNTQPIACRVRGLDRGDVQAQLEAGPAPRHPHHPLPENRAGQLLTIGRGGDRNTGIGMQMIHMRRIHQTMHRGINARRGAALAVQAEIERRDHLILPLHPRIHLHQRPHPIQPSTAKPVSFSVPRSPPEPFTHNNSTGSPVTGSVSDALGGGVPARIVGVLRIRTQPVRPADQIATTALLLHACCVIVHAPHPACWPPTRSSLILA